MPSLNNDISIAIRTLADTVGITQTEAALGKLDLATKASADTAAKWSMGAKAAGATVAIAAVAVAAVSIKAAGDYQQSLTKLVTSAGEVNSNMKLVSTGILQVAKDTGTSTQELTAAMYKVESGGQHGAAGLTVLKAAAQGAKAEGSDLTTVADALTSVLVDYHLKADDAANVTSKLVAATAAGKMSFQDLAGAMPAILPIASAAHVSLNDILGDLASMTVHGMSADQASQNLAHTIEKMNAPTAVQAKELALLGMNTQQLADDMQNKGLSGTLDEISKKITNLMPPGSNKAVLDMTKALSQLSPVVQELGAKVFDGTMTISQYTQATKDLDPIQAKQAQQFATMVGAYHQIGNAQMTGKDIMQNYSQAMYKATGDSTGLRTALMLTGDNAQTTANAIKSVSGASADASGNVKGWTDITATFNNKLDRFSEGIKTAGIALGMQLLPAAGQALDWIMQFSSAIASFDNGNMHMLTAAFVALAASVAAFSLGGVIAGLYGFIAAGGIATTATRLLAGAFALLEANPLVFAFSALIGVGTLLAFSLANTKTNTDGLKSADDKLKAAQDNLKKSSQDLKQAQDDLAHAQLNAQDAALRVEQAQQNYNMAVSMYGPTSLQARQAALDLRGAQLDLKDANDRLAASQQNVTDKTQANINQTKSVQNAEAAKQNVIDSTRRFLDNQNNSWDNMTVRLTNLPGYNKSVGNHEGYKQSVIGTTTGVINGQSGALDNLTGRLSALNGHVFNYTVNGSYYDYETKMAATGTGVPYAPPHKAGGGAVTAGQPYIVGDNPDGSINSTSELFIPSSSGTIVNAKDLQASLKGGGASHVTHNTFTGNIYLGNSSAVTTFFDKLNQDTLLSARGLSPRQGL